jgi:predicted Holliday junction resolvase-like endonuclease
MDGIRVQTFKNEYGLLDKWTYKGDTLISTEMTYPKTKIIKKTIMSKKQELFEAIEANFNELAENNALTTKASQQRARKAAGEIKKLITDYRKASVAETK